MYTYPLIRVTLSDSKEEPSSDYEDLTPNSSMKALRSDPPGLVVFALL